jgi:hypothetical protein
MPVEQTLSPTSTSLSAAAGNFRVYKRQQAELSRRRLYPVTVFYTAYSALLLYFGLRSPHPWIALGCYALGLPTWTFIEYFTHRWVLHGQYKPGPGIGRKLLVKYINPLHWEHHERPFDGEHINGELQDLLPLFSFSAPLTFLFPVYLAPMVLAGVVQCYVIEEWIHYSVHFTSLRNPYFRYIRKHHIYHHTSNGMKLGYGFTSAVWDVVYGTRFPEAVRRRLYGSGAPEPVPYPQSPEPFEPSENFQS